MNKKYFSRIVYLLLLIIHVPVYLISQGNFEILKSSENYGYSSINTKLANEYRTIHNLPSDFPATIIENKSNPLPGNYFLSSRFFGPPSAGTNYMFCVDTCGTPIFFQALNNRGSDFRRQPNGYLTHFPGDEGVFIQYDSSYNVMREYAANGSITDMHELLIEEDGSYWILTKQLHLVDMSVVVSGGNPQATVEENIIQHLDYSGNIIFQWNSLEHISVTDCDPNFVDLTGAYIDYIHINALDLDIDGNLLLSSRHLNEITKINAENGNVIWRWGGSKNQFTFINDENGFYGQHSIRGHGGGSYSLFDNGNWHTPPRSRGLEYILDEVNMTATLVTEYITNDGLSYTDAMGHMQRTEDGGSLVGWAANTQGYVLTDYKPDGSKALDIMNLDTNLISYRAYKYEWETNAFYFTSDTIVFDGVILPGDSVTVIGTIYNNTSSELTISGFHTNNSTFSVVDDFPSVIPAKSENEFTILFKPDGENYYSDALTIYSDSKGDSLRIAAQTRIIGGLITTLPDIDNQERMLNVWPNPIINNSIIEVVENDLIKHLRIYDISGRLIQTFANINTRTFGLNRIHFESGVFVLEVETLSVLLHRKIVVN